MQLGRIGHVEKLKSVRCVQPIPNHFKVLTVAAENQMTGLARIRAILDLIRI
ncbi:hypothetical protein NTGBS_220016 [Candidatus Nitrotoga sp. BS]|nr:hypothetical protein NTGBS_220016 [Candidatus Nitrotoga sp. BS]